MLHRKSDKEKGVIMSNRRMLAISGAALLVLTPPCLADVTPEQVWQNWQDLTANSGQTITVDSVTRDGASLVIKGLQMNVAQQGANAEGRLSELLFTDAGDGTVNITLPPNYPITMKMSESPSQSRPIEISMEITQEDALLKASGDIRAVKYDLSAPSLKLKLTRIDGLSAPSEKLTGEATLANIKGSYTVTDTADLQSDFSIGGLAMAVVGADGDSEMRMTVAMQDLNMVSAGKLMGALGGPDFSKALQAGAANNSEFTAANSDFDLEIVDGTGPTSVKGAMAGIKVLTAVDAQGLDYSVQQTGLTLSVASPSVPIPNAELRFDELGFGVQMPVMQSETVEPFGFQTRLTNVTLSDQIWSMIDPAAALPRDPMNLVIETDGLMKVTGDTAQSPNQFPAQIESMNLNTLKLSLAGTELTGNGSGQMRYPQGSDPVPSADLNFKLTGANALMDRLVAAGFISADQLMMPRMMLAMIAQPDPAGGDALTSRIEMKDKGVFANGQKLYDLP